MIETHGPDGLNLQLYAREIQPLVSLLEQNPDPKPTLKLLEDFFAAKLQSVPADFSCHTYLLENLKARQNQASKTALLLLQHLPEYIWYKNYQPAPNLADANSGLINLETLPAQKLKFKYQILDNSFPARVKRFAKYRLRGKTLYTVGMQTAWSAPATIALLNEIGGELKSELNLETFRLQVNSIFRSTEHQQHLFNLGYAATLFSSHCFGLAADIEQSFYRENHPHTHTLLKRVLQDLNAQQVVNLMDAKNVWHICLNPQYLAHYTAKFKEGL